MSVSFTGNWDGVQRFFSRVKLGVFNGQTKQAADELGHVIADRVRDHIRSGDLPWEELAPSTVMRKGHSRPYIDTLAYMRSIQVKVERPGRFSLRIEVFPQGKHPSGLTMAQLAAILERRRPLWGPTFDEVQELPQFKAFKRAGASFRFSP